VRALSLRAAKLTVQDEGYECELELRDSPRDSGDATSEFRCMLTLDPQLVEGLFGAPAPTFHSRFQSEEKATRRAAKAVAKSVNDRLQELEGLFMLGPGPQGVLMVIEIPQRPPAAVGEC